MLYVADIVKSNGFLEKMFTWKYFEPVLFGSIVLLLILLFLVLALGKKDQKKKLEETKKLELESLNKDDAVDAFAKEEAPAAKAEVKEEEEDVPIVIADASSSEEPKEEPKKEEEKEAPVEDNSSSNDFEFPDFEIFKASTEIDRPDVPEEMPEVVNADIPVVAEKEEIPQSVIPEVTDVVKSVVSEESEKMAEKEIKEPDLSEEKIHEFKENFADLASSISRELDEINKMQAESSKATEEVELPKKSEDIPNEVDVTPIKEASKFNPSSIFSSVYSPNSAREEEKPALKEEDEIPFELPKKEEDVNPFASDMPAKKDDMKLPKIGEEETPKAVTPDFSNFENETYDIK